MKVVFRPAARQDVLQQVAYLLEEFAYDAAHRFPDAVEEALAFLARNPEAGAPRPIGGAQLRGLRSWAVPGFEDIRIYYLLPAKSTLRIIRVLHGKARYPSTPQTQPRMRLNLPRPIPSILVIYAR